MELRQRALGLATSRVTRVFVYYALLAAAVAVLPRLLPGLAEVLTPPAYGPLRAGSGLQFSGLDQGTVASTGLSWGAGLATVVSMLSALVIMVPVAWVYIITRQGQGYDQSVVHTLLILPIAVASIAVGATVGVAPEARLYFIGIGDNPLGLLRRCSNLARGIWRLLEVNRRLPEGQKLRVISISNGWSPGTPGYNDVEAAVREARENGIFVVSSNLEETYGFRFHGLGRSELADPDQFQSYEPGLFWANEFYRGRRARNRLLIPMDSRTIASPTGNREYVFDRGGGWSWSIPYIAGVYALAAQVDPTIAPERFWATALKTGRAITLQHGSQEVRDMRGRAGVQAIEGNPGALLRAMAEA